MVVVAPMEAVQAGLAAVVQAVVQARAPADALGLRLAATACVLAAALALRSAVPVLALVAAAGTVAKNRCSADASHRLLAEQLVALVGGRN